MNQKKVSVHGLQNIGALLGRADAPKAAPKRERSTVEGIANITAEKIIAQVDVGDPRGAAANMVRHYIKAGIRDAYNLGHAEALGQNSAVDKLLEKQYETRTRVTTPAVVCAVMEQSGLSSMTLDMAMMATVFERCDIDYVYNPDTEVIEYTMRPAGAFTKDPLAVPFTEHPEEIDPTDPRDELGELDPGLAFDHETEDDRPTEMITPNERLSRGVL
nr:MAG TPA: hypothetical protein [Caudoviricetes sp.]